MILIILIIFCINLNYFLNSHIMKLIITGSILFIAFATLATADEWSWGKGKDQAKPATDSVTATDRESKSIDSYSEANDDNVGSQEGGDSVASLSGNETDAHARHLIKDRLCGLGLMEVTIAWHLYNDRILLFDRKWIN